MRFVFRMRGGNLCACVAMVVLAAICHSARADLRYFSSGSTFTSSNYGLSLEDFESANVSPTSFVLVPGPVDSSTPNAAFGVGSLISGFSITGSTTPTNVVVTGTGNILGASKTVGVAQPQPLNVAFTGASAVGFNLITATRPGPPISTNLSMQVFGSSGLLGTQTVSTAGVSTFIGVRSTTTPITKIQITDPTGASAIFLDNLDFGAGPGIYNSRSEFTAVHPTLPTEGFESAKLPAGAFSMIPGPVNSSTSNPMFDAGSVMPGFSLSPPPTGAALVVTGTNTTFGGTKEVGGVTGALNLTFTRNQSAVGMDLIATQGPGPAVQSVFVVTAYSDDTTIFTQNVPVAGVSTFLGLESASTPITRIEITSPNSAVLVDNLTFDAPEPGACMIFLVAGAALLRRRRRAR